MLYLFVNRFKILRRTAPHSFWLSFQSACTDFDRYTCASLLSLRGQQNRIEKLSPRNVQAHRGKLGLLRLSLHTVKNDLKIPASDSMGHIFLISLFETHSSKVLVRTVFLKATQLAWSAREAAEKMLSIFSECKFNCRVSR